MKKYVVLFTVLLMVFCGGQKNNAPTTQDEDTHEHGQEGQVHEEDETPASPELQAEEHEEDEHQDVRVSLEKQ